MTPTPPAPPSTPTGLDHPLFTGLWDDAALFPPGNRPMSEAVPAHRLYATEWYARFVRHFLVGTPHLPELLPLADPRDPLRVVLIATGGAGEVRSATRRILDTPGLLLEGVEVAARDDDDVRRAVTALHENLPEPAAGHVEVPRGPGLDAALDRLRGSYGRPKFRTGGTTAGAFPGEAELAAFLVGACARDLPFKCTAGLHSAVRHTDPVTGFEHHGYLNLMLATHHASRGADPDAVADVLRMRDARTVAAAVTALSPDEHTALRRRLTSYGTCSIAEPLEDALTLGLLDTPRRTPGATGTAGPKTRHAPRTAPGKD